MGTVTRLFGLEGPHFAEATGLPEHFCDIAVVQDFGETVRIVLGRNTLDRTKEVEATGLILMPRGGFMRSLGWAATQFLWTKH